MTQNNIKIAITGGIGSGKSEVCKILKDEGMPVLSCDDIYAELCLNSEFLRKLSEVFGDILTEKGTLDRQKLSEKVFTDSVALKKLNEITHPAIMEELFLRAKRYKICFCEVPLLFENGFETLFDSAIVVLRDKDARIKSIINRDKISKNDAVLRINNQFDYDKNDFTKYYVIHNNSNLIDLRQKTLYILKKIINSDL